MSIEDQQKERIRNYASSIINAIINSLPYEERQEIVELENGNFRQSIADAAADIAWELEVAVETKFYELNQKGRFEID